MNMFSGLAPTAQMIETLMDCHERELQQRSPCTNYDSKSTKGLYIRGFLDTKIYKDPKGKSFMAFYVTKLGKTYLNSISEIPQEQKRDILAGRQAAPTL